MKRSPKVYATLRRHYTETELKHLGFRAEGALMVKRGGCRVVLATASASPNSLDSWRVTPLVRHALNA